MAIRWRQGAAEEELRGQLRANEGRDATASGVIIDSQWVRTTEKGASGL